MLVRRQFNDLIAHADAIAAIRCGRVVMRGGRLETIQQHAIRTPFSIAQVWWESKYGRPGGDVCWLDYHVPRGLPQFLTLDYIRSGRETTYRTFVGACHLLDEIARLRGSSAIVAHVSNAHLSDRLLARLGWQRHLTDWPGRHFIRRFYDGYPPSVAHRYVDQRLV